MPKKISFLSEKGCFCLESFSKMGRDLLGILIMHASAITSGRPTYRAKSFILCYRIPFAVWLPKFFMLRRTLGFKRSNFYYAGQIGFLTLIKKADVLLNPDHGYVISRGKHQT